VSFVITVSFAASSRLLSINAQWQTERQPQSAEMQVKPDVESLAIGETRGSGVDLVDLVDRVDQGEPGDTGGFSET
jgi:hypothetical protein